MHHFKLSARLYVVCFFKCTATESLHKYVRNQLRNITELFSKSLL